MMSGALLLLGVVVTVAAAQVAPVSVSELLSNPDRFRDQPVTVSGTMSHFREYVTRRGTPYYTFDFGDGTQTVRVVSYETPQCRAGAATVEGTFEQAKWRVRVSYSYEEIRAWKRDLLPRRRTEDGVNAKRGAETFASRESGAAAAAGAPADAAHAY
jgi:hypothetical protein